MKYCSKCQKTKSLDEFSKKSNQIDGLSRWCKDCKTDADRSLYLRKKEIRKKQATEYYNSKKEDILKARQENRETYIQKGKEWRKANPDKVRAYNKAYRREKRQNDPLYILKRRLTGRIREALKGNGWKKLTSATASIGCNKDTLRKHIESQFTDGMTWDNYGKWQVDHIVPISSAKTEHEVYLLNHYKNLRPLWAVDNYEKWDKPGYYSDQEIKFLTFLTDLNVGHTVEIFNAKDLEITCPDLKIKLLYKDTNGNCEYNKTIRPIYHLNLTRKLEAEGYKVLQITNIEWETRQNQVKSFLKSVLGKNSIIVHGRKTEIRIVDKETASKFLDAYHILGTVSFKAAVGLYYNNELIAMATLGNHHRGLSELVLNRYVGKENVSVAGGLSRLTKYIKATYGQISTWVDLRISNGANWEKCGWKKISQIPPDYSYYDRINDSIISKQSRRKALVNTPDGMTEHEHALKDGLYRIYDCGKIKLVTI